MTDEDRKKLEEAGFDVSCLCLQEGEWLQQEKCPLSRGIHECMDCKQQWFLSVEEEKEAEKTYPRSELPCPTCKGGLVCVAWLWEQPSYKRKDSEILPTPGATAAWEAVKPPPNCPKCGRPLDLPRGEDTYRNFWSTPCSMGRGDREDGKRNAEWMCQLCHYEETKNDPNYFWWWENLPLATQEGRERYRAMKE